MVLVFKLYVPVNRRSDLSNIVLGSAYCPVQAESMLRSFCFMGCILCLRFAEQQQLLFAAC